MEKVWNGHSLYNAWSSGINQLKTEILYGKLSSTVTLNFGRMYRIWYFSRFIAFALTERPQSFKISFSLLILEFESPYSRKLMNCWLQFHLQYCVASLNLNSFPQDMHQMAFLEVPLLAKHPMIAVSWWALVLYLENNCWSSISVKKRKTSK